MDTHEEATTINHDGQGNWGAVPKQRAEIVLRPMDPNQARYWSIKLRALADLLAAGEPLSWGEPFHSAEIAHWSIHLSAASLTTAEREARRRVDAGDPDYAVKVAYQETTRRDRRGRPY